MDIKSYCPMTFSNSNERGAWNRCDEDCAWYMTQNQCCAVKQLAYLQGNILNQGCVPAKVTMRYDGGRIGDDQ